ncbi:MAG: GIY-YIG nuclease family protein, partial [Candidatus Daviesbacteria bacterium]|nr:GIY-YIG nuclease family protein [Candidatus Daviesbacteria bacterium]
MIPAFLDRSKIPHRPGVYIFRDASGHILYVGKAIDLYHRVSSYFTKDPGARNFVSRIAGVETIIVESELEALILEANLIKKNLPPFNVRLTDDKDYLYIVLTNEDFPRVLTARRNNLKEFQKFWGPFPSSRTVKETLRSLRRVFPWCASPVNPQKRPCFLDPTEGRIAKTRLRPCFYFHLKQCPGACVGLISQTEYRDILKRFSKFMDGKKEELVSDLLKEMEQASKEAKFEEAGRIKKTLEGITYLTQTNRTSLY